MRIVSLAGRKDVHLLGQPVRTVFALEFGAQIFVDIDQVGDVGERIFELLVGKRAMAPVGEARRLVEPGSGDPLDELVVGDAVAEAADHCRDLRVEDGMRDHVAEMEDDLDVLPRSVEDLDDLLVRHQAEEGCEVDVFGKRIDQGGDAGRGHLDQAQDRPERRLANEFGIDGDEARLFELGDDGFEFGLILNEMHVLLGYPVVCFSFTADRPCVNRILDTPQFGLSALPGLCASLAKNGEVRKSAVKRPRSARGGAARTRIR